MLECHDPLPTFRKQSERAAQEAEVRLYESPIEGVACIHAEAPEEELSFARMK